MVLWKILRLFVNTLTANDKYSLLNRDNLTQPIQILLYQKQMTFSQYFSAFLKSTLNFEIYQKKDDRHRQCISEITNSKCLKNPVLEDPSTSYMGNGPKHCCILDDGIFATSIDHCEHNSIGKSLFQCYAKS